MKTLLLFQSRSSQLGSLYVYSLTAQSWVRLLRPLNLDQAMELPIKVEEKLCLSHGPHCEAKSGNRPSHLQAEFY